jgi:hypothetical protein
MDATAIMYVYTPPGRRLRGLQRRISCAVLQSPNAVVSFRRHQLLAAPERQADDAQAARSWLGVLLPRTGLPIRVLHGMLGDGGRQFQLAGRV